MLRFGNQIRLAPNDRNRLRTLCGGRDPGAIQTVAEYNAFIDAQLATLPENTATWRLAKYCLRQLRVDEDCDPGTARMVPSDCAA
jgi:hypothetical protein